MGVWECGRLGGGPPRRWGRNLPLLRSFDLPLSAAAGAVLASLLLFTALPVQAQSSLVEELRAQRVRVRMQEVTAEMSLAAAPRLPVEVPTAPSGAAERLFWWLPPSRTPRVVLPPLEPIPAPEPEPAPERPTLGRIVWDRVGPAEQEAFLDRFREALWTVEGMHFHTSLDTLPTPEVRARLFSAFGAPTRTAVARGVEGFEGSIHVQFEYWFVANDSIPFVALDVDGPFGRGLVLAGDYADAPVLGQLKRDLSARLLRDDRLMPYVDYYFSEDRDQWYRTGYDGTEYYVEEIDRPRWARRSEAGRWYLFR